MLHELNFFSALEPNSFHIKIYSKIVSKKTLTAISVPLHNITGSIKEGQEVHSLENRVLFLKVEISKKVSNFESKVH